MNIVLIFLGSKYAKRPGTNEIFWLPASSLPPWFPRNSTIETWKLRHLTMRPEPYKEEALAADWMMGRVVNPEFILPVAAARSHLNGVTEEEVRKIWLHIETFSELWKFQQIESGRKPRARGLLGLASLTQKEIQDAKPWYFATSARDHVDLVWQTLSHEGFQPLVDLSAKIGEARLYSVLVLRHAAEGNVSAVLKAFAQLYVLTHSELTTNFNSFVDALPHIRIGRKIKQSARKSRAHLRDLDQSRWAEYQEEFDRLVSVNPALSKDQIQARIAKMFKVSKKTIWRHTTDHRES